MKHLRIGAVAILVIVNVVCMLGQQATKHLLNSEELKKAVPTEYFFAEQKAPVQVRNAAGLQLASGKMVLAALVDASGYSTAIQQKYQGMLITEVKLNIGGAELPPGQYGFGFTADNKFMVMDVGNSDLVSAASATDTDMKRPIPLKLVEDGEIYKLYGGRKWIAIRTE